MFPNFKYRDSIFKVVLSTLVNIVLKKEDDNMKKKSKGKSAFCYMGNLKLLK